MSPLREIGKLSVVGELLVTVTLPFEILSVVASPHTESATATESSTIDAVSTLCFKLMSPDEFASRRRAASNHYQKDTHDEQNCELMSIGLQ